MPKGQINSADSPDTMIFSCRRLPKHYELPKKGAKLHGSDNILLEGENALLDIDDTNLDCADHQWL